MKLLVLGTVLAFTLVVAIGMLFNGHFGWFFLSLIIGAVVMRILDYIIPEEE
jgi:hypothetical protein